MTAYSIVNWDRLFENNRTRELKKLDWVPIPNKHDGDGFTELMDRPNGVAIFGAWVLILQLASKCNPRGCLYRQNPASPCEPHTAASISRITRCPEKIITDALSVLVTIGWIERKELADNDLHNPAGWCGIVTTQSPQPAAPGCLEGKGREVKGIEQNGTEGNGIYHKDSRTALWCLNEACGKHFRELDANLKPISARLSEPEVTIDGVRLMISRQVKRWKGTNMEEYLRPETLFGKTKFDGYYSAREQPVHDGLNKTPESQQIQEELKAPRL
jgi:uncharacterized phage protein (TIGR02220 family)